jgi:cell division protein FtsN
MPAPVPSVAAPAGASATAAPPTLLPKVVPVAGPDPAAAHPRPVPLAAPVPAAPPPAAKVLAPTPAALPVPAAAPKAAAARAKVFGVHVSSFRKRATADADARRLGLQLALPARVLEADLGAKGVWYRVVVGEVGSAAEASALRDRLSGNGIPDGVVLSF